ncbi:MAG: glycosyltransferase family 4 protein [Chthoniobacteraceae bacterium]
MNIAHFASDFYPNLGGVQEFVRQLAREQQATGHRPLIVTNRWPKTLPKFEVYEHLPVHRAVFRVPEPNWWQLAGAAVLYAPTRLRLLRILMEHEAEVIHIQGVGTNAVYALQASRHLKLPLVATLHGELSGDRSGLFLPSAFARKLLRRVLDTADALTVCSQHMLREVETFYGRALGERARVIPNGVRNEEFSAALPHAHPRPYLLAIGRHVPEKGFDLLLRAFDIILRSGFVDHDLLIAGTGPEREALEHLAKDLGISDRVCFPGPADRPATARLFAGCSFFVLPSRMEPRGIVSLEAMAAAKAVVATRVGGVPEMIAHEQNGLLVEPENAGALANAMVRLIADRDLRKRLGAAGREQARCLDWSCAATKYDAIYETLRLGQNTGRLI